MVEAFGGKVIQPGDADWPIPESEDLFIQAAAAVGPDSFVFAAALEGERHSLSDLYSRFYRHEDGRWLCVEVATSLVDLLVVESPDIRGHSGRGLAALGAEGEVWFVGDSTRSERITNDKDAGMPSGLTRLRRTGGVFFAAGLSGRCFRREGSSWVRDDDGLRGFEPPIPRKRKGDVGQTIDVADVATAGNGDQYLCGSVAIARPALFWRPGGAGRWRWLGYAVDDPAYDYLVPSQILVESDSAIWITTDEGLLVKGDARQGFRIATDVAKATSGPAAGVRASFSNAVLYDGAIHVGSNVGPFRLRPDGGWDAFAPSDGPEPADTPFANGLLAVSGHVMWAFGIRTVARYDGQSWAALPIPNLRAPLKP